MAALTGEEFLAVFTQLREATADAHRARRDLTQTMKTQREQVRAALETEVARQVGSLVEEARARLFAQADAMLAALERDWRQKLGLPDR